MSTVAYSKLESDQRFVSKQANEEFKQEVENTLDLYQAETIGIATASTNPGTPAGYARYDVYDAATLTNFLDDTATAIEVTTGDLDSGKVLVVYDPALGYWEKKVIAINLSTYTQKVFSNTFKQLSLYCDTNTTFTYDKATRILTWTGLLYAMNGAGDNSQGGYFRINSGSLDFTALAASQDFWVCYVKPNNNFWNGVVANQSFDSGDIIVKSWLDATLDIRDDNAVLLFTYNKRTNRVTSPFLQEAVQDQFLGADGDILDPIINELRSHTKLQYARGGTLTFNSSTKVVTWGGLLYVFLHGKVGVNASGYLRVNVGSFDIGTPATASSDTIFVVYAEVPDSLIDGTYTNYYAINPENLKIKGFNEVGVSDVRKRTSIILFYYNKITNKFSSPFLNEDVYGAIMGANPKLPEYFATHTKLQYSHRGSFNWNNATKVLSWSSNLYIFLYAASRYMRMDAGSLDFATATASSSDEFWVAYVVVSDNWAANNTPTNQNKGIADIVIKSWTEVNDVRLPNALILFWYNKNTGEVSSPFFDEVVQSKVLAGGLLDFNIQKKNTEWDNRYPNVIEKLPVFAARYNDTQGQTGEDKRRIIMLGDSLFARETHTSVLDVVPSENPPGLVTKNFGAYLFQNLKNKPSYARYDKAGAFTETGTFSTVENDANWDDAADRPTQTRISTSTNAATEFTVASAVRYFNFIDRTDTAGTNNALVTVGGGDGLVECRMEGSPTWAEANLFSFSQLEVDEGARRGNTIYQRRIEFRKIGGGIGTAITITIGKGTADASRFLYWGLELINGNKPYTQLINVARGGHTLSALYDYLDDDVKDRKPDLVILEIPLINMLSSNTSIDYSVNWLHDFVWGDRAGNTNSWNLKTISNNWADFNVLLVIPHYSRPHYDANGNFIDLGGGYTAQEIYQAIKGLIIRKGDLPYIDISAAFYNEIKSDYLTFPNQYAAYGGGVTGNGYTNDGLHQNDKGTLVWAKHIIPTIV